MAEFYNESIEQETQIPNTTTQSDIIHLFKNTWEYLLKFIKAPIATIRNEDLDTKEAAILLGFLPISLFLSMWSLMRSMINIMVNFGSGLFGTPSPAQMRSEALAEIGWGGIFFNGLLTSAAWFALIMFVPLAMARIFKNMQPIDTKKLFSQMVVITIPVTLLFLLAAILGFLSLWLWFVPVAVSLVLPLLLHFVVVRNTFRGSLDKALYVTFITQVVIAVIAGFWLNAQINNLFADIMGILLW